MWIPSARESWMRPTRTIEVIESDCTAARDTVDVHVENLGPEPITFTWNAVATAGGEGDNAPPGASVTVTRAAKP